MNRRGFLIGLGAALVAAPAIVRIANIMPVRAPRLLTLDEILRAKASMIDSIGPTDRYKVFLNPQQYADLIGRKMSRFDQVGEVGTYNGFTLVVNEEIPAAAACRCRPNARVMERIANARLRDAVGGDQPLMRDPWMQTWMWPDHEI